MEWVLEIDYRGYSLTLLALDKKAYEKHLEIAGENVLWPCSLQRKYSG